MLDYNSQNLETTQVSINRRMDQQAVVDFCDGVQLSIKQNEGRNMDKSQNIMLKEESRTHKSV